ncbi:hypothetical protein ACFE04_020042 [Oxalis oulophora]
MTKIKLLPSHTYVVVCWIFAASGGFLFGYDVGISGGVTAMEDFQKKFFPKVYQSKLHAKEDNYCKYNDPLLQLFTSSLYLSAMLFCFVASLTCKKYGRKGTILAATLFFILGAVICSTALNLTMLIVGRIIFGIGVGFGNEAVPLFLSEIAPSKHRGAVNILFQLFVTIGIFAANLINYETSKLHPYGWRVSLGLTGIPAVFLFFGGLIIPETPTSLMERGKEAKAAEVLKRIRGIDDVDEEFNQVKNASEIAKQIKNPYKNLFKRSSVPPLFIAIALQVFVQCTGINAIMFYAPVLFQTVGLKNDIPLLSAVIIGIVNVLGTLISIYLVDKSGRRKLLLAASVFMFISHCAIGGILAINLKSTGSLPHVQAISVVVLVCVYVIAFAWSLGPLGWLIPSETFTLETRTAGFAFAVASKTKGVPIDAMVDQVWSKHPVWKKFM